MMDNYFGSDTGRHLLPEEKSKEDGMGAKGLAHAKWNWMIASISKRTRERVQCTFFRFPFRRAFGEEIHPLRHAAARDERAPVLLGKTVRQRFRWSAPADPPSMGPAFSASSFLLLYSLTPFSTSVPSATAAALQRLLPHTIPGFQRNIFKRFNLFCN